MNNAVHGTQDTGGLAGKCTLYAIKGLNVKGHVSKVGRHELPATSYELRNKSRGTS